MPRSVKVHVDYISKVKSALARNGYIRQTDLAEHLQMSQSTVSNFLNARAVDYLNFIEICRVLNIDWQEVADLEVPMEDKVITEVQKAIESQTNIKGNNLIVLSATQPAATTIDASLEYPEGQVTLNSSFYINRPPIEERSYEEVCKPGSLIRIKAPRQMGKTSLLSRILYQAEMQDDKAVYLSLQLASEKNFTNPDTFLKWLCASIALSLKIPNKLNDYWYLADIVGSNMACKAYLEEYLLPEINKPLTLGLDEVDRVFEYSEIYRDFFGLLRALHEEAKRRDIWKKLRLLIVHSTEVYVPMDVNQSPFNVGLSIELPEFTATQVLKLAQLHQLNWSDTEVKKLMKIVGGHPFLVRLALYHIARQDINLTQLLQTASTSGGIYSDHLRRQELLLAKQPELASAIRKVVSATSGIRLPTVIRFKLHGIGLVKLEGDEITPRCKLYRDYFQNY